jgi:hypothetical protein
MRHAHWRMCHQNIAPDPEADIKKETIMVTVLGLALIPVVVDLLTAVPLASAASVACPQGVAGSMTTAIVRSL